MRICQESKRNTHFQTETKKQSGLTRDTFIAMTTDNSKDLSKAKAQEIAERTRSFLALIIEKKAQLFGRNTVSPKRAGCSGRLQRDIDNFFQEQIDQNKLGLPQEKPKPPPPVLPDILESASKKVYSNLESKQVQRIGYSLEFKLKPIAPTPLTSRDKVEQVVKRQ